jgi:hypothetical protein
MMYKALQRSLKVFLCHTSGDKVAIRALFKRLKNDGIDVWLDEENLLPGQDWQMEIPNAVQNSDAIIVCISRKSITKEGYVQKEINFALNVADEKPEGTIFIIPCRLEACNVPVRFSKWQYVDLFYQEGVFSAVGYEKLLEALNVRAAQLNIKAPKSNPILKSNGDDLLQGKWEGEYQFRGTPSFTVHVLYTFLSKGQLKVRDNYLDFEGSYWVDFSTNPAHLDLFEKGEYINLEFHREAILEFVENDVIRLEHSSFGGRPSQFGKNAIILRRAKI